MKNQYETKDETKHNDVNKAAGVLALALIGIVGSCLAADIKYQVSTVPIEGKIIREYGRVRDGSYGFELLSEKGRTFFVNIDTSGKYGKENGFALSEAVDPGDLVKLLYLDNNREYKDPKMGKKTNAIATYPSSVEIIKR